MSFNQFQHDLFKAQIETALDRVEDASMQPKVPTLSLSDVEPIKPTGIDVEKLDLDVTRTQRIETADGTIWVDGNTLMCSCPDCNAPMSIRIWLGLADCWACESCIELTAEQLRAARRLMERQQPQAKTKNTPRPEPQRKPEKRPPARQASLAPATPKKQPERRQPTALRTARAIRNGISTLPAWLISFIIHLVILLLLAIYLLNEEETNPAITISTFISADDKEGGDPRDEELDDPIDDDASPLIRQALDEREERELMKNAKEDAEILQKDENPLVRTETVEEARKNVTTKKGETMSLVVRDPRLRSDIVKKEGGTTLTEACVSRGLRWLASVQNADGSWSIDNYNDSDDPSNTGDAAGTSLALLPFLGAGQTHEFGPYKTTVARGIKWLKDHQEKDGDLRAIGAAKGRVRELMKDQWGMYTHGQATIVLVEAFALTGDEDLRDPAQRAIDFIQNAQHVDHTGSASGGWRYQPGDPGDTSVFGWQLMALQSARNPELGLKVQPATMKLAGLYLDSVSDTPNNRSYLGIQDGSLYRYLPNRRAAPTAAMTAEGILCRMYLGWKRDDPRVMTAVRWLMDEDQFPSAREPNMYYWYYGTQVMHHYGGEEWEKWNSRMRDLLVLLQTRKGRYAGSWSPSNFRWGSSGGRIYTTSLAICSLEVYYRHIPLFRQIDLE